MDFNCQSVVNPLLDIGKFLSADNGNESYGGYTDRELDKMFEAMNASRGRGEAAQDDARRSRSACSTTRPTR